MEVENLSGTLAEEFVVSGASSVKNETELLKTRLNKPFDEKVVDCRLHKHKRSELHMNLF